MKLSQSFESKSTVALKLILKDSNFMEISVLPPILKLIPVTQKTLMTCATSCSTSPGVHSVYKALKIQMPQNNRISNSSLLNQHENEQKCFSETIHETV